jgi:hypothetical protein
MNIWWEGKPSENLWVEITDRNDLGSNIKAPISAQKGKKTSGYELPKYVKEGDVVLHWWKRAKNRINHGFYGYSTVVGSIQDEETSWTPRGRYSKGASKGPKPSTVWTLGNFNEFQKPVLIGDINLKKDEILKLISDSETKYGKPIYFPFCKREGKIAVNQTYFAKLPHEFIDVMAIDFLSSEINEISSDVNRPLIIPEDKKHLTRGLSRQSDPIKRIAVEKYAEDKVYELLKSQGYEVDRFGKPFDLLAVKNSEIVKVEVKGKQQIASTVEVTINEVKVVEKSNNEYRTLLAVVDDISLTKVGNDWVGNGGRIRLWWDHNFNPNSLYPSRFVYTLPIE